MFITAAFWFFEMDKPMLVLCLRNAGTKTTKTTTDKRGVSRDTQLRPVTSISVEEKGGVQFKQISI